MKRNVKAKQQNSRMCFVCGLKNPAGLGASFYELDSGELLAMFTARDEHQSYPGRLHGGISTSILDETIGRAILTRTHGVIGRIVKEGSRIFEGTGEILLEDGSVAVEGRGRYVKMPLASIADFDFDAQEWKVVPREDDPAEVDTGEGGAEATGRTAPGRT